jgi:hypothetical protein
MGKLIPEDISFPDTAPYKAEASVVCPAPARMVFAVLKDNERWAEWAGAGITSVKSTSNPGYGLGSTRRVTFWGIARLEEKFIEWEEPKLYAFTGINLSPKALTKLAERFRIEAIDETDCRITYNMGADFPLLLKPISGILTWFLSRTVWTIIEGLRKESVRSYRDAH